MILVFCQHKLINKIKLGILTCSKVMEKGHVDTLKKRKEGQHVEVEIRGAGIP
jgi:hypothetical protein